MIENQLTKFNTSVLAASSHYNDLSSLTFLLIDKIKDSAIVIGNSRSNHKLVNSAALDNAYRTVNEGFTWFAKNINSRSSETDKIFNTLRADGTSLFKSLESEQLQTNQSEVVKLKESLLNAYSSLEQAYNAYSEAKDATDALKDPKISTSALEDSRLAVLSVMAAYRTGMQLMKQFIKAADRILD